MLEIISSEVSSSLAKMNRNKGTEPDGIVIEMLAVLDSFDNERITDIIN